MLVVKKQNKIYSYYGHDFTLEPIFYYKINIYNCFNDSSIL